MHMTCPCVSNVEAAVLLGMFTMRMCRTMQAMARLWRVAHFVLNDFLDMPLPSASAAGHSASGHAHASGAWGQHQGQPTRPHQPESSGVVCCPVWSCAGALQRRCSLWDVDIPQAVRFCTTSSWHEALLHCQ